MELTDNGDESCWTAKFGHDFPQTFPAHSVEGLGQVNKGGVENLILLLALLLKLASSKDHVHCTSAFAESTLAFWEQVAFKVVD